MRATFRQNNPPDLRSDGTGFRCAVSADVFQPAPAGETPAEVPAEPTVEPTTEPTVESEAAPAEVEPAPEVEVAPTTEPTAEPSN